MRLVFVVALACGTPAAPVHNEHPAPASPLARARDFELGRGVARDYRAAADIYRDACRDGQGDAAACRALIKARLRARGVALDRPAASDLGTKLCLAHEDVFGCVIAALASPNGKPPEPLAGKVEHALAGDHTCDASHLAMCDALLVLAGFMSNDPIAERANDVSHLQMCRVGLVDGCTQVRDKSAADEVHRVLDTLCDAGDADACHAAFDRDTPDPAELCKAHDYDACAIAGCLGDTEAGALADANHTTEDQDCKRVRRDARDPVQASADLRALVDQACACITSSCARSFHGQLVDWAPGLKATAQQKTDNDAQLARFHACLDKP